MAISAETLPRTGGSTYLLARIDALTSLRFLAAFYVLVLHSGSSALIAAAHPPAFFERFLLNGYLGVNFFFVLSGFILAYIYQGKLEAPYFSAATWRYGVARFARVYPVYVLALALTIAAAPGSFDWSRLPQFALLQCWAPLMQSQFLANDNGPAWTLSIELFFYILCPLILKHAERLSTSTIVTIIAGLFAAMIAFRLPAMGTGREGLTGTDSWLFSVPLPVLRTPEFAYGLLLGILRRRQIAPSRPSAVYAAIAATIAVLCSTAAPWVASAATICFGALILFVAGVSSERGPARLLSSPWLVLLGNASYALYLLQQPVHMWLWSAVGDHVELAKLSYVPALIVLSIFVFLFYETPLRDLLRKALTGTPARA